MKKYKTKIPELRFPGFEGEWENKKLGKIGKITMGQSPESNYYNDEQIGLPLIQGNSDCENRKTKPRFYTSQITKKCYPKDIILSVRAAPVGEVSMSSHTACIGRGVCAIKADKFLYYYLIKKEKSWIKYAQGSTFTAISRDDIFKFPLCIPSLPEQTKIANFLSSVDTKIEQISQQIELLQEYKKGVMQQLFPQKGQRNPRLRFKDDEGNEFPDWERKRLGEVGNFKTSSVDKKIKHNEKSIYLVNYMDVYKHKNIQNKDDLMIVTASDHQISTNNLQKGDILFTPSSETPDDIGHSIVIFRDLKDTLYSYHLMRFRPKVKLDLMYSHYFCNIPNVLSQFSRYSTGSTRYTISVKSFSSIIVNIPSLPEQTKIANFLSSLDAKIEQVEQQLEQMQVWKKGLLQKMFV